MKTQRIEKHIYHHGWWKGSWKHGISFGSALAIVLSYTQNNSLLWAIIHGILSWFYVIYRIILLYT